MKLFQKMFGLSVLIVIVLSSEIRQSFAALGGDRYVHDPSLIRSGHCYYIFCSEQEPAFHHGNVAIRRLCNDQSVRIGALFDNIPNWFQKFTKVAPHMWAPDVNFINGEYYVYYAGSSTGSRNSAIALATASHVEGPYVDRGEVIHTTDANDYNAIDPEIAWTIENGKRTQLWLVFGSYWTGIKARRLDMKTGHLSNEDTKLYSLASRNGGPIEGCSTAYHNGFYYLFASFDYCCRGVNSTYNVRVGRSHSITGPYVDKNGVDMMKGGGTEILGTHGNQHGPGGLDVILDGNVHRMIYHFYDADEHGSPKYDIVDLIWSADNWPTVGAQSRLNYS